MNYLFIQYLPFLKIVAILLAGIVTTIAVYVPNRQFWVGRAILATTVLDDGSGNLTLTIENVGRRAALEIIVGARREGAAVHDGLAPGQSFTAIVRNAADVSGIELKFRDADHQMRHVVRHLETQNGLVKLRTPAARAWWRKWAAKTGYGSMD